jgi:RNA polymerase sigma-70 factor (ECF subfamily)
MVNHRPTNSISLVDQARAGNPQAIADLLGMYRNYLRLLARIHIDAHLQAKADPSDLVQETCLLAARDLPQFRGETEAEFVAWLRQILTHAGAALVRKYKGVRTRDIRRERQLEQQFERSSLAMGRLVAAPNASPSRIASRREAAVILADALTRLPQESRDVLVLCHLEGMPIAEVAARMGRTLGSVRGLRTRALLKLRAILKEPA